MNHTLPEAVASNSASLGQVHASTSNIIGQSLMTAATMLAFYFTFQGAVLAFFPTVFTTFHGKSIFLLLVMPLGNVAISLLALVALIFHAWAYFVVRTFIDYFGAFLEAGSALEAAPVFGGGIYTAMRQIYQRPGPRLLYGCTVGFFIVVAALWIVLGSLPWVLEPKKDASAIFVMIASSYS